MKKLDFSVPFTGFSIMDYFNCFAAVYTYLEHPNVSAEYKNGWDYNTSPDGMQMDWYFIFGTMSGYNSLCNNFDKTVTKPDPNTEYCDFCMKFAGYSYKVVTENFLSETEASIDAGYPVIARLTDKRGYRVLIGVDGETLTAPDPHNAQGDNPDPKPEDIELLFIITAKGKPQLTLLDGLRNIESSLVSVIEGGMWENLASHVKYWDNLNDKPFSETQAVFKRLTELMWDFDHCHNVAEVFRHKAYTPLQNDCFIEPCIAIDRAYDVAHNTQWAVQALHDCRDWNKREWQSKEWGMCMFAEWGIERLKKCDEEVLAAVREMITLCE